MLLVIKSGFYSSIQDDGRFGFRSFGVPVSGAMDIYSFQYANMLLGNDMDSAAIEMTMVGGTFQFLEPTQIVVSGADMQPKINTNAINSNTVVSVEKDDVLSLGRAVSGFRSYLAVKGGLNTAMVLNSRSQYNSITHSKFLNDGDVLDYNPYIGDNNRLNSVVKYKHANQANDALEAFVGPEFNLMTATQQKQLVNSDLIISKYNNRMAYQLNPLMKNNLNPILTSPVLPGTIQLTPSGRLIVLMRDCQTTGGYPRILQLTEKSINTLSQKSTGEIFKIRLKD